MAPKRGRPAAAEFAVSKKPAKADAGVPKLCGLVSKALEETPGFPESVLKMLIGAVPASLAILKEERHAFQEKAVSMIGEALAANDAALDKVAADAAAKLVEATGEKDRLASAVVEAEEAAKQLAEAEVAAKAKVADDKSALQAAKDASYDALAKQVAGDRELSIADGDKVTLEALLKEHLVPLVDGTTTDVNGSVKAVVGVASGFVTEASLLESLPTTLGKPKDNRGTFDALVIKQLEEAASTKLGELNKMLSEGGPAKEERAAAVASASQASGAAAETLKASEAALTEAKAALKAGENKVKDAKGAAKKFEADFKKVEKESQAAAAASTGFKEGALKAFAELKERATPPPPPVADEPPAGADAAPAEPAPPTELSAPAEPAAPAAA